MVFSSRSFDDLLQFASTSRSKSIVTLAAVSFAVCHVVAIGTTPALTQGGAELDAEIPRQLIHFAAVLGRFVLPLGVMIVGIMRGRSKLGDHS
ncbi:MAG TPA: hypothetical protein VGJ20_19085 [Xanthobacteraceae bacterium]|jgi:hypothetical protein